MMRVFPIARLAIFSLILFSTSSVLAWDLTTVTLPGSVTLTLARIPAGSFQMGRYSGEKASFPWEDPQHTVTIAAAFYMGKYEVTKAQWKALMGTTPWSNQLNNSSDDLQSPAVNVSWEDIAESGGFIERLNQHITSTGQGPATYRLPSEAEWEYSCRAGTRTRFYWGDDPSSTQIGDYAWYRGNAFDYGNGHNQEVGHKLPNAWDLYDMSGNILEWCEDLWHDNYTGAPTDGSTWISQVGSYRLLRGGNWFDFADRCRSATRYSNYQGSHSSNIGFRLMRILGPSKAGSSWLLYE